MICERCGIEENSTRMEQRRIRKTSLLCVSCVAKPTRTVKTAYGVCEPWDGEYDPEDNPIDDYGHLFRPGFRKCGNSDCVAPSHIFSVDEVEMERHDLSYRTGVKLTMKQFIARLMHEKK